MLLKMHNNGRKGRGEFQPLLCCSQVRSAGKKTPLLRHLYIKCIILPRQARDKHRENSKKVPFSLRQRQRGRAEGRQGAAPAAAPRLGRHRVPAPLPQVLSQSAQAALHRQAERARLLPRGLGRRLVQDGLDGRRGRGERPAQAERGVKKRSISEPDLHKCDHFTKTGSGQT